MWRTVGELAKGSRRAHRGFANDKQVACEGSLKTCSSQTRTPQPEEEPVTPQMHSQLVSPNHAHGTRTCTKFSRFRVPPDFPLSLNLQLFWIPGQDNPNSLRGFLLGSLVGVVKSMGHVHIKLLCGWQLFEDCARCMLRQREIEFLARWPRLSSLLSTSGT